MAKLTSAPQSTTDWGADHTGPFWAAQAFPPRAGQDHLGLGSVSSDRILARLSPGINVLTIHPRYWSFYAFVLDEFWAQDLPRTKAAFKDFYRPREAMFAFACQVCEQPEHATVLGNIVGSRRTAGPAADDDVFDPGFDYIKEPLGGYGLYYRSVMEAMELAILTDPAAGVVFDAPTLAGRAMADAYRKAVQQTRFYRDHLATLASPVPRQILVEFAAAGCLCQLRTSAPDLPLLQDLFLHAGAPEQAARRRATLRFLLDVCRTAPAEALTQDRYRQLIYFRTVDADTYKPVPGSTATARQWRLYQAREYFSFALNRLWAWLTRRGVKLSDDGLIAVTLPTLWSMLNDALDANTFAEQLGMPDPGLGASTAAQSFASWLTEHVDATGGVDDVWPRHGALDEHALYQWRDNDIDDGDTLIAMLALLLLVYRRVGTPGRMADLRIDADLLAEGGSLRVGMARFYGLLHKQLLAGRTVGELLRWILTNFVIVQHERVATAKLPDDTFRFRRVGDTLRFFPQETPVRFNDSRFIALSTVAHELDLVSALTQPQRTLTPAGQALLDDGDLPGGVLRRAAAAYLAETP